MRRQPIAAIDMASILARVQGLMRRVLPPLKATSLPMCDEGAVAHPFG